MPAKDEERTRVLEYVRKVPARSTSEIAEALGIDDRAAANFIGQLAHRGLVRREYVIRGRKLNRVYPVYPQDSGFDEDE